MVRQPKYPAEEYTGLNMPFDDMDVSITGLKSKLVKTKKRLPVHVLRYGH